MLPVAGGVALAATIDCTGGPCLGTRSADTLFGSPGEDEEFALGGQDLMYGGPGDNAGSGNQATAGAAAGRSATGRRPRAPRTLRG